MTIRAPRYLYLYKALPITVNGAGTGKTVTAKLSAIREGAPVHIGTLTLTLVESGTTGNYFSAFARADLLSQLLANHLGKRVYLHLDDGVVWHEVYPMQVTDVDPALLPPLNV